MNIETFNISYQLCLNTTNRNEIHTYLETVGYIYHLAVDRLPYKDIRSYKVDDGITELYYDKTSLDLYSDDELSSIVERHKDPCIKVLTALDIKQVA